MTETIRAPRRVVVFGQCAVAAALVVLSVAVVGVHSAPAQQTAPRCGATVDGQPTTNHDSPRRPLRLDVHGTHHIRALVPTDATRVRVAVDTPVGTHAVIDTPVQPGSVYDNPNFRVDEKVAPLGVGLYRVRVSAGSCEQTVWVRLIGRSPLTTVTGVAGVVGLAAGVVLIGFGMARAVRGRGGIVRGVLGGAIGGFGALLLSQQLGWVGITSSELVSWIALPALGGGLLTGSTSVIAGSAGGAAAPAPATASTTSATPPTATPSTATPSTATPSTATPSTATPSTATPAPSTAAPPPAGTTTPGGVVPPPVTPEADPPRSSYARIEGPAAVVAGDEFLLVVGLAPEPVGGVLGAPITRPETSFGPYTLSIQVVADGFDLVEDVWRRQLAVRADAPYPTTTYKLRAQANDADVWSRPIQALYAIDGQTVGVAIRTIAVVARADLLHVAPPAPDPDAHVIAIAPAQEAPDLTARITYSEAVSDGRLLWTFETPHPVPVPATEVVTDIGTRPEAFAAGLIAGVASHRGDPGLVEFLTGIGRTVSEKVPEEFFTLLDAIANALEHPPRVLLLSQEPYVPWELATLEPPLDAAAPPFLSAQADVGRWVFGARRPPLPPPVAVDAHDIAVVCGVYPDSTMRLVDAEEEADSLVHQWHATSVNAAAASVISCLKGSPPADVLHFALHGTYAPEGMLEGLLLVDGERLDPMVVKGCTLARAPFVFLNACQVGSGNEVLGDYAGLAEAFLHAGAAAVIAPLWSIDDVAAKQLALRFYTRVFTEGVAPAAVLRDERRAYGGPDGDGAATRLAYQYFGHPALLLRVAEAQVVNEAVNEGVNEAVNEGVNEAVNDGATSA